MSSEIPKLLVLLKQQFRLQGIRYAEVAERLGISEATAKRYMAGKGLSVSWLERLCQVAGLQLSDLTELLLRDGESRPRRLSIEQELKLSTDLQAAFVFYLLRSGWTAQEVAVEFGLDEIRLFSILRSLEKVKLINVMPKNKARVLTARHPDWLPSGPVRRAIDRSMIHVFQAINQDREGTFHDFDTVKLTDRGLRRVQQALDHLAREVRAIAASERAEPGANGEWYSVLSVAQRVDPTAFFHLEGEGLM